MEDRRYRAVRGLLLTTVIILSVFVQSAYAGPEKSAESLYNRVVDIKQLFFVSKVTDVREDILNYAQENKVVRVLVHKLSDPAQGGSGEGSGDEIVVIIEQIPLKKVQKQQDVKSATFTRGHGREIRQEDIDLLARIIHAEARGESFEGQVAVGAVVLNRVQHSSFPKTIKEVIYQPGQFTAVDDGQIELPPNQRAYQAAQAALDGQDPSNGAIFYYNPEIATDTWIRTRSVIRTIGNHLFCV